MKGETNLPMIKQIIPVSDDITPVIKMVQDDGSQLWEDAAANGWMVLLGLMSDDEIHPIYIDPNGDSVVDDLREAVAFRPTVRCPKCGQRMWVQPHESNHTQLEYDCPCGTMRRFNFGQTQCDPGVWTL